MKPGVHERKWEIDSLCFPIRLAYQYWKTSGDASPFDAAWQQAIGLAARYVPSSSSEKPAAGRTISSGGPKRRPILCRVGLRAAGQSGRADLFHVPAQR